MPKIKVGDINIYYEIHGKGEPFVLIPGRTGNVDTFFMHIPVFAQEYQVIAYDPRGAGQSDAPDIHYTIEMMADDLDGLFDAIGIDLAHILGASLGGAIALQFALLHPEKVRSLILACTSGSRPQSITATNTEMSAGSHPPKAPPLKEIFMQQMRLNVSQEFIDKNPLLVKRIIEKQLKHPAPFHGFMRQGQISGGQDIYEKLSEIKAPTLVIHGDADIFIPAENGRVLASKIPGAELAILKKMGHGFMTEAFDDSNRIILNFLRRHRSSSKKG